LFARNGATVVLADLDVEGAQRVLKEVEANGGTGRVVKTDVSNPADSKALVDTAVKTFGRLDIAVNNAGIGGATAPVGEYPLEGWDRIIAINLSGVFYGMRHQIPAMLASGGGAIVNMSSIAGKVGLVNAGGYVAAKHGVIGLTETAAIEYGEKGIRVNAVAPGPVWTPLNTAAKPAEEVAKFGHDTPMGRPGQPEEIAPVYVFLASNADSGFITGEVISLLGGDVTAA
jgi:NAD(P)-dependent dehydrogenase (short-subunit alcohol dehydrogenase family)